MVEFASYPKERMKKMPSLLFMGSGKLSGLQGTTNLVNVLTRKYVSCHFPAPVCFKAFLETITVRMHLGNVNLEYNSRIFREECMVRIVYTMVSMKWCLVSVN